jgi:hypothetical protein
MYATLQPQSTSASCLSQIKQLWYAPQATCFAGAAYEPTGHVGPAVGAQTRHLLLEDLVLLRNDHIHYSRLDEIKIEFI